MQYATNLCNLFRESCITHSSSLTWLAGDLNLPNVDWKYCHPSSSTLPSSLCNIFIDFVLEHGFTQIVDFPTREHNILDVFFTNRPSYEYTCKPLAGISNHEIVYITSAVDIECQNQSLVESICGTKQTLITSSTWLIVLQMNLSLNMMKIHQLRPFGMTLKVYVLAVLAVYHPE